MGERIVRISATGPDGAGKDTAWRNAKTSLPPNLKILKIGKPSSCIFQGKETYIDTGASRFLDSLHTWADARRSKMLTSMANTLYVMFQWRYQEPFWTNKIKPDVVFSLRDGYADPAAYAPYYMPNSLGRLKIPRRIDFLRALHGSPFRDLTIFLDIDPNVAVARIDERIKREALENKAVLRPKWQHQHENIEDLTGIRDEFLRVLDHLCCVRKTQLGYINTTNTPKEEVGSCLATKVIAVIG